MLLSMFFYIYGGGASEVCCGVIIIFLWILLCFVLVLIISNRERISGQHHKFILIVLSSWPQLAVSQAMPFQAGSQTAWKVLNNLSVGALVKFKKRQQFLRFFIFRH